MYRRRMELSEVERTEARLRASVRGSRRVAFVTHAVLTVVIVLFTDLAHLRMQRLFRPDWGQAQPVIDRAFVSYLVALMVLVGVDAIWWWRASELSRRFRGQEAVERARSRVPALLRGAANAAMWLLMFIVGMNFLPLYDGTGVAWLYLNWGIYVQLLLILVSFGAVCGLLLACLVTVVRFGAIAGRGSRRPRPTRGTRRYGLLAWVVMMSALTVGSVLVYPPSDFAADPPGPQPPWPAAYALLTLGLVAAVIVMVAGYRADRSDQYDHPSDVP